MIDSIGNRPIGNGRTFFIAEACSNIVPYAKRDYYDMEKFVEAVALTGADAIKVQLFSSEHFPEAEWEAKKQVEFPRHRFGEFVRRSRLHGLLVGASVFDDEAVDLCVECQVDFLKLATREHNNLHLLQMCQLTQLPIIRSYDVRNELPFSSEHILYMACVPKYPVVAPHIPYSLEECGWSS